MDGTDGMEQQLEASRQAVSDEPIQIQTPAAVWLPYNNSGWREPPRRDPFSALLAPLLWATRLPARIANWGLLRAQRLMTGTLPAKLAGYFAIGMPIVLGCAVLYSWVSGKPLMEGLRQAYGNLYKVPGTKVLGDVNWAATLINNLTYFLGTFTFALILGVITEDVSTRYARVREGNYPVDTRGHTLLLNWTPQLVPLLRQMQVAQKERGAFQGSVVILCDRDKQAMDHDLRTALGPTPTLDVTTRSGPPTSTLYLDRAAAAQAATVVVLAPEGGSSAEGAAERQVASLLALQTLRESVSHSGSEPLPPQTVILQSPPALCPQEDSMHSAGGRQREGRVGGGHPVVEATRNLMRSSWQKVEFADLDMSGAAANIMAQSAVQPGVASVYCSLVQQTVGGTELYIRRFPELANTTYGDARRRFPTAAVIGYITLAVSPDVHGFEDEKAAQALGADVAFQLGQGWPHVHLNPPDSDALLDNSALILVAQSGDVKPEEWQRKEFALAREKETARGEGRGTSPPPSPAQQKPRHVFVVEWGADSDAPPSYQVTQTVAHLKARLPEDSMISVIGPAAPEVDCSQDADDTGNSRRDAGGADRNLPHHMHDFEEGVTDASVMRSQEADVNDSTATKDSSAVRKTVHLQHIAAGNGGGQDLRRAAEDAGLPNADAVVVLSSSVTGEDGGAAADAHTLAALVLFEDMVRQGGRRGGRPPLHVLGKVNRAETIQVANHLMRTLGRGRLSAELLQPDELTAGTLTQMAAEPLLRHVLERVMMDQRGGATVKLVTPSSYDLARGRPLRFADVAERVRSRGGTALGYIGGDGKMVLGPKAWEERVYGWEDRLVVLG